MLKIDKEIELEDNESDEEIRIPSDQIAKSTVENESHVNQILLNHETSPVDAVLFSLN